MHTVDSWTVENLMFENKQEEARTPLKNLVVFNNERINMENIDPNKDYPYIEIKSVSLETGVIEPTYTKGSDLPARAKLIGRKGDILLSIVRPDRGIITIVPSELDGCVVSNTFVVLTPQKISPEYLYLLLKDNDVRREFSLMARGTTTPTLGIKELKNYSLPLSEVPRDMEKSAKELYGEWRRHGREKRSLKDIVEGLFVKELLEVEVIREEDEQDQYITLPYEELIDRWDVQYHIDHATRKVLWSVQTKKLGDLGEVKIGASIPNKSDGKGNIPYIRVQDLDEDSLYVVNEELVYVEEDIKEKTSRGFLSKDDILISRIGNFGRSALVQKELDGALANHNLAIFRPKCGGVLPKFLAYFLKTKWAKQQFNMYATGLFLQSNFLKEVLVPVPSLAQQSLIIESIEQEFSANKIEELERETLRFTHQIECVEKVYDSFVRGDQRGVVQIATGAGKTSVVTALLRRLLNLKQAKRILYLTDKRLVVKQFKQVCKEKLLTDNGCNLIDSNSDIKSGNGVWIGLIHEMNRELITEFDFIILDGFNPKWIWFTDTELIEGYVLGITSTPIQSLPTHDEVLKSMKLDEPIFTYDLNQAIFDGHLTEWE